MSYLRDHWHGRHSLARSFWVNFVLLRLLVEGLERLIQPPTLVEPQSLAVASVALFVLGQLVLYPWQVVGLVRATNAHIKHLGSMSAALGVHLTIAVSLLLVASSAFSTYQNLFLYAESYRESLANRQPRVPDYRFKLVEADKGLHLSGPLDPGITRDLRAFVEQKPQVVRIILESDGGHVFEARGLAALIQEKGFDTLVESSCKSACATVFIAGRIRSLTPDAKIGFHQYELQANLPTALIDVEAEQRKDRLFYQSQGVGEAFLERVFDRPHEEIWEPSSQELVDAGVAHRIEDPVKE